MPGFGSQPGHLLARTQAVPGTYQADIATLGIAMKLRSGALGADRDLLITDPEIGGGRDVADAYLGAVKWSGDYEYYVRLESMLTFLYAALGTKQVATTTGVSTHTITPSDAAALPYLSLEEQISTGFECFQYTDAVVNSFHLESEANGYLMGSVGLIAAKQLAGATPTNVDTLTDGTSMIVGTNITVTYNGVQLPAQSFSLDIANNFEDTDFRLGSFYLGSLVPKRREVTLGVKIRNQDSALWRQAVYGTSGATAPGGLVTKNQVVLTCTTYEDIVGGTPATKSSLTITIPKVAIEPFSFSPSGDDILDNDISLRALRPALATPIMTAVVKVARATIA